MQLLPYITRSLENQTVFMIKPHSLNMSYAYNIRAFAYGFLFA